MNGKRKIIVAALSFLFATSSPALSSTELFINDEILWQSPGTMITTLDLVKQMDLYLAQNTDKISEQARKQFYLSQWPAFLKDLIDQELVYQEAKNKQLHIEKNEIRDELIARFGTNYIINLDNAGLSYKDVCAKIEKEITVQRMIYYKVHYQARQQLTPAAIKQAYRQYLQENPNHELLSFEVYNFKAEEMDHLAHACELVQNNREEAKQLMQWQDWPQDVSFTVSYQQDIPSNKLSQQYNQQLQTLEEGQFSSLLDYSTQKKKSYKLFFLTAKKSVEPKSFSQIKDELEQKLYQQYVAQATQRYFTQLHKEHEFQFQELSARIETQKFIPFQTK